MTDRPWKMEVVGNTVVESHASKGAAMTAARWWIGKRYKARVRHQSTGECWEWRGTWIKTASPARRQAGQS